MFHLFNEVYLDSEWHISSKYESILLTNESKDHPMSKVIGIQVGQTIKFDDYMAENYLGDVNLFWQNLLKKNPKTEYVVYADEPVFLRLLIQYWKSIFKQASLNHLKLLFNLYKKDVSLKNLAYIERGDNRLGNYFQMFQSISDDEFAKIYKATPIADSIKNMDKNVISIEYLLAEYFYNNSTYYVDALKAKIMKIGWTNWCADINDLRSEFIRGFDNLNLFYESIDVEFLRNSDPIEVIKSRPELTWMLDKNINPDSVRHIIATYPKDFFSRIQLLVDKFCQVCIKIKGIESTDVDIFNHVSRAEDLYRSDFKAILDRDIKGEFSSLFLKGNSFSTVNHALINFLYARVRMGLTDQLVDFELL